MKKFLGTCFNILLICLGCSASVNAQVLSNEKITISINNQQSWTGINNTGNLSYYGCTSSSKSNSGKSNKQLNSEGSCVHLTGGKINCRDGICRKSWKNNGYSYILSSPITESIEQIPSTLTIYFDSKVILEEKLYPIPFDNI